MTWRKVVESSSPKGDELSKICDDESSIISLFEVKMCTIIIFLYQSLACAAKFFSTFFEIPNPQNVFY